MSDHGSYLHAELARDLARRLEERDERTRRAHAAAAEVTGLPPAERAGFVRSHPDCLEPEFIELMIAIARERRGPAPEESVAYAHLAAAAAEAAHEAGVGVDEQRGLAFAELGNAHRICGDLRRAGIAFQLARERVRFAADPLVRAEVDSLEASYLDRRCDFAGAERLLLRAERAQRQYGSPDGVGKLLIKRAQICRGQGDSEKAVGLLHSALGLIDHEREPQLALVAVHNLAASLIDIGNHDEALSLLRRHRREYERTGSAVDPARLVWLEAKAALSAGLLALAEASFEEAREGFAAQGRPYEAALISLDLTEVYALIGRWDDVEQAAAATLALCHAGGVEQEALAAAAMLYEATVRRHESLDAIARLVSVVRGRLREPAV